jgi:hypothetical protein
VVYNVVAAIGIEFGQETTFASIFFVPESVKSPSVRPFLERVSFTGNAAASA